MIIHQLKTAHERGVKVRILLDGGNLSDNQDVFEQFKKVCINVYYDKMLTTGSFNFTSAADKRNAENVLLIDDSDLAKLYI